MDTKTNQELFKQALVEGVSRRIDREIAACDEEIVCSRRHKKAMRAILNGKTPRKPMIPVNRRVVAALIAAALLLLAGCAIIYRDEIRDFITDVREFFVKVTFDEGESESRIIEEIYELTYIPEGYSLKEQRINRMRVQYVFESEEGNVINFNQRSLDVASFLIDSEHSDTMLIKIEDYTIYSRETGNMYYYLWNDGKYAFQINSNEQLSEDKLLSIIDGLKIKQ